MEIRKDEEKVLLEFTKKEIGNIRKLLKQAMSEVRCPKCDYTYFYESTKKTLFCMECYHEFKSPKPSKLDIFNKKLIRLIEGE